MGKPEIVGIKYEIPAEQKLSWHHHPVMNHGILVQGNLTIISLGAVYALKKKYGKREKL